MTVTGFSFIRNAVKYDFPIVESLKSILPLVDKLVVAVGAGEDNTRELIAAIDPENYHYRYCLERKPEARRPCTGR